MVRDVPVNMRVGSIRFDIALCLCKLYRKRSYNDPREYASVLVSISCSPTTSTAIPDREDLEDSEHLAEMESLSHTGQLPRGSQEQVDYNKAALLFTHL